MICQVVIRLQARVAELEEACGDLLSITVCDTCYEDHYVPLDCACPCHERMENVRSAARLVLKQTMEETP